MLNNKANDGCVSSLYADVYSTSAYFVLQSGSPDIELANAACHVFAPHSLEPVASPGAAQISPPLCGRPKYA